MKNALLLGVFLFSLPSFSAVWQTTRQWTSADEARYSNWVEQSFRRDIFSSPSSRYYGMQTDCADMAYTMRAIFAFEKWTSFCC
jgi:hypothetical protein